MAPHAPHVSMSPPPIIILYDLPSHNPQPWAPNIWKVRYVYSLASVRSSLTFVCRFILNYKKLHYRTTWVEFPDVDATLRSIGAPPSAYRNDGRPIYSLPVIVDPSRSPMAPTILSNANTIAEYLESTYPARPVFPEGSRALQSLFVHYVQEVFSKPLLPIMIPISHDRLPQRSQSHFRHPDHPTAVTPPHPTNGNRSEQAWYAVQQQFDFLATILDKNAGVDGDGVVVMGRDLTYADFALCSVLLWIEKMSPYDGWARIRQWNGGRWSRLWDRCRDYMDVY